MTIIDRRGERRNHDDDQTPPDEVRLRMFPEERLVGEPFETFVPIHDVSFRDGVYAVVGDDGCLIVAGNEGFCRTALAAAELIHSNPFLARYDGQAACFRRTK